MTNIIYCFKCKNSQLRNNTILCKNYEDLYIDKSVPSSKDFKFQVYDILWLQ